MLNEKIPNLRGLKKNVYVAEKIIEEINNGKYMPGDKLPPERLIAEEMGVSRSSLREALSALQIAGIIETMQGNGTYVIQNRSQDIAFKRLAINFLKEYESPFEALRARKILESGIISFLVSEITNDKIEEFEPMLEEMDKAVEADDFDSYFEINKKFHLALAKATNNSIIERFIKYLLNIGDQPLWLEAVQKYFVDYNHIKKCINQHRGIILAIKEKDKDRALCTIKSHFDDTVDEVKKYL